MSDDHNCSLSEEYRGLHLHFFARRRHCVVSPNGVIDTDSEYWWATNVSVTSMCKDGNTDAIGLNDGRD